MCRYEKETVYILYVIVWHWHAKDTEPRSTRIKKHDSEWSNKPRSQYQAWHNTLSPF